MNFEDEVASVLPRERVDADVKDIFFPGNSCPKKELFAGPRYCVQLYVFVQRTNPSIEDAINFTY